MTDPNVEIVSWHGRRVFDRETGAYLGRAVGEPWSDGAEGLISLRQDEDGQSLKRAALCAFVVLDEPVGLSGRGSALPGWVGELAEYLDSGDEMRVDPETGRTQIVDEDGKVIGEQG